MTGRPVIPDAAMTVLGDRMRSAREALGLSQSDLARKIGVSPQAIQALEAGRAKSSKHLHKIAIAVQRTVSWLAGDEDYALTSGLPAGEAPVRGIVAAGLWQSESAAMMDQTAVPSSPDDRFSRYSQIAFRVVGNSMNNRVRDGEYVICVDYGENPLPLRQGDVVVAERRRGGEIERTVKSVRIGPRGPELWPDSSDPQHRNPLVLAAPEDDTEVIVVGLVVGYYRPA